MKAQLFWFLGALARSTEGPLIFLNVQGEEEKEEGEIKFLALQVA